MNAGNALTMKTKQVGEIVRTAQSDFEALARVHNAVTYQQEASFAMQILQENDYLMNVAIGNPESLKRAVINVAAVGLSLNPLLGLAYLLPRKKKVCLDISYIGYIHLAIDSGAIKWVSAEIVREKDEYQFRGHGHEPLHRFDPFADRGVIRGAYVLAKSHQDEFIVTQMSIAEIFSIRDRSESWKAYKANGAKCPWVTDEDEMIKKTALRRARKMWPKAMGPRLEKAIEVTGEAIDDIAPAALEAPKSERDSKLAEIRSHLVSIERTEAQFIGHVARVTRRKIERLEELTDSEIGQAIIQLKQWAEAAIKKAGTREDAG